MVTFAKVSCDYWANNPGSEEKVPKAQATIPVLIVEQAAEAILKGLKADKVEIIEPLTFEICPQLEQFFPGGQPKNDVAARRQQDRAFEFRVSDRSLVLLCEPRATFPHL